MSTLFEQRCRPCADGEKPLTREQILELLPEIRGWNIIGNQMLRRTVVCRSFMDALELMQRLAPLAESENHHPDLHLTGYRNLAIELTTHAIGGLSRNDFILAAKMDRVLAHMKPSA